jgi:hypothetical protein
VPAVDRRPVLRRVIRSGWLFVSSAPLTFTWPGNPVKVLIDSLLWVDG